MDRKNFGQLVQGLEKVARSCEAVNPELDRREVILEQLSHDQQNAYAKAIREAARGVATILFDQPSSEIFEPVDQINPQHALRIINVPNMGSISLEKGIAVGQHGVSDYKLFVASRIVTQEQDLFSQRYLLKAYFFHPQLCIGSTVIDRIDFGPSINDIITVEDSLENLLNIRDATLGQPTA